MISIHIPQGEKLTPESVSNSLKQGRKLWGENLTYVCHSWLLYPGLEEILPQSSNIFQFQKNFLLWETDFEEREAEWRIFGKVEENPKNYPEKTSLQRNARNYLLSGKKLGNGLGMLKTDGNIT